MLLPDQFSEVPYDDVGAVPPQRLCGVRTGGAVHADDEGEPSAPARLHTCQRVLDDGGAVGADAEPSDGFQEEVGPRLARQRQPSSLTTVDQHLEQVQDPGAREELTGVAGRGGRGQRHPRPAQGLHQPDRPRIGVDAVRAQPLGEQSLLLRGDGPHRLGRRIEAARGEEGGGPVRTGLAVHVPQVVVPGVERASLPGIVGRMFAQEGVEGGLPGGGVHTRRVGDHSVGVEDDGPYVPQYGCERVAGLYGHEYSPVSESPVGPDHTFGQSTTPVANDRRRTRRVARQHVGHPPEQKSGVSLPAPGRTPTTRCGSTCPTAFRRAAGVCGASSPLSHRRRGDGRGRSALAPWSPVTGHRS